METGKLESDRCAQCRAVGPGVQDRHQPRRAGEVLRRRQLPHDALLTAAPPRLFRVAAGYELHEGAWTVDLLIAPEWHWGRLILERGIAAVYVVAFLCAARQF